MIELIAVLGTLSVLWFVLMGPLRERFNEKVENWLERHGL